MKWISCFIFFIYGHSCLNAKPDKDISYNQDLQSILDQCLIYRNTDVHLYELNIEKLIDESIAHQNKYYEAAGLNEKGFYQIINTNYQKALDYLKIALSLAEEIEEINLMIDILTFKGIAEKELYEYYEAIQTFKRIRELSIPINRSLEITGSAHMLAEIYKSGGDLDEAYNFFIQSRPTLSIQDSIYENHGWWYLNFSDYFLQVGDFENSRKYSDTSLMVWNHLDMTRGKGYTYNHLGDLYFAMDLSNCTTYYNKAIAYNQQLGNKAEILKSYMGLGNYHHSQASASTETADSYMKSIRYGIENNLEQMIIPALDYFLENQHLLEDYNFDLNDLFKSKIKAQEFVFRKNSKQGIQLSEAKSKLTISENEKLIEKNKADSLKKIVGLLILISTIILGLGLLLINAYKKLIRSQSKIKKLNDELSENLGHLQEKKIQLEYVNERRLKIIDRLKKFASILSHDLKEPVRTINSFGDLVKRNTNQNLSDKELSYINLMTDGAKRMHNMISTLYKYSNDTLILLQAFSKIELNKVIKNVTSDLTDKINEKKATIIADELCPIEGQEILIYQLFQNLISNALKYSKPDIDPVINIYGETTLDEFIKISIEDNGIGIAQDEQASIFDLFKRTSNNIEDGHGIGLATCKEIVEIHSGQIWLESKLGVGTTIHITLPVHIQTTHSEIGLQNQV